MQTLSMTQFKKYCEEHTEGIFTYDSRNNVSLSGASHSYATNTYNFFYTGHYDQVIIMLNPNRVCFRNEHATITVNDVEKIIVTKAFPQDCYDTVYILCKGDKIRYTIMVDEIIQNT